MAENMNIFIISISILLDKKIITIKKRSYDAENNIKIFIIEKKLYAIE